MTKLKPRRRVERVAWEMGGNAVMAKAIGTDRTTVYRWVQRDRIPAKWQSVVLDVAKANGIELKAEDLIG